MLSWQSKDSHFFECSLKILPHTNRQTTYNRNLFLFQTPVKQPLFPDNPKQFPHIHSSNSFVQIIPVLQGCVHLMYSPQDALNMIPESKGAILQPADLYISPTYAEKTHSNKT